jgi:hypothetical protein
MQDRVSRLWSFGQPPGTDRRQCIATGRCRCRTVTSPSGGILEGGQHEHDGNTGGIRT